MMKAAWALHRLSSTCSCKPMLRSSLQQLAAGPAHQKSASASNLLCASTIAESDARHEAIAARKLMLDSPDHCSCARAPAVYRAPERLHADWLAKKIVHACVEALVAIVDQCGRGQCDDRNLRSARTKRPDLASRL